MPRSRLGPLAVESKLGDQPSRSHVWRAVHVQLQRAVAVKIFSFPFGATPEARTEFANEWETLKTIDHPTIIRCYGGGFEETDAYLAYELIEGETLAAQLDRRSVLAWESVLDLAEPMADALDYLHQREIIHGAIDPSKVIFAGLSPVLLDVRVNRFQTAFQINRPRQPEEVEYVAPELLKDSASATPQSDLYSLGAVMYHALTGRPAEPGTTESPASIAMECPIWLDKVVMQMLAVDPEARPPGAPAVKLALAEARRRSMSRAGATEFATRGFSPLNVDDQKERDEARILLGQSAVALEDEPVDDATAWHDKSWVLIVGLIGLIGFFTYVLWPLNENQMRVKAEALLSQETRNAMQQAKSGYLEPMLERFPEGEHATWAREQLDRVTMLQAEHALSVKLKRNLPLKNEGERLYAEANQFERFGDAATALDRYRSMITLLDDDPQYLPYVNLARRQIAEIESKGQEMDEAARIISSKLEEADRLQAAGQVIAARKIWYGVVELYGNNDNVAPLVRQAQERLAEATANPETP
ncbi:MAG: serine/threonine-protein kinase [Planctomycetota bacterium]